MVVSSNWPALQKSSPGSASEVSLLIPWPTETFNGWQVTWHGLDIDTRSVGKPNMHEDRV